MRRLNIFGPVGQWPDQDLIAATESLDPDLTIAAYRSGVFPMPLEHFGFPGIGWWSPMRRGVLTLDALHVTRSLRKMSKRYTTTIDTAFSEVIAGCANPDREHGWIDDQISEIYHELHRTGWAHSVETWDASGRLVGGLYGISLGGLFAGESMFHDPQWGRDASKVALMRLVDFLSDATAEERIIDTQWLTPHLASLGVMEIDRAEYLDVLDDALLVPEPLWPQKAA